jgi:uncharacterized repeat protein (TIGR01451 family)
MITATLRLRAASLLLVAASLAAQQQRPATTNVVASTSPLRASHAADWGKLPLSFEPHQVGTAGAAQFVARGPGYGLQLTGGSAVLNLTHRAGLHDSAAAASTQVAIELMGAEGKPLGEGLERLPGKANYLIGHNPETWRTQVPTFAKVRYRGVYPGIDLLYYGSQRQLEYDFVIAPGGDPNAIALRFRGAEKLELSPEGDLIVRSAGGELRMRRPKVYQTGDKGQETVAGSYLLRGDDTVAFRVGSYDQRRPLVIDPVLAYSTYFGGTGDELAYGIAVDGNNPPNAYVVGRTCSAALATGGVYQPLLKSCGDIVVLKLNATGDGLYFATYLGGTGDETPYGIALDPGSTTPNIYITGVTNSADFPLSSTPYQSALKGRTNAFYSKLDPTGTTLLYSTYLGSAGADEAHGIGVDASGTAYIVGHTTGVDFPLANNTYGPSQGGVYVTTNGASSWALSRSAATILSPSIWVLGVAPAYDSVPSVVYAGTTEAGVWTSNNGGSNWSKSTAGISALDAGVYALLVDPANPAIVYAGGPGGVWQTSNSGGSWTQIGSAANGLTSPDVRAFAFDPAHNLYAGTNGGGVFKLPNGGGSWTQLPLPTTSGQFPNIDALATNPAVPPASPATIYAGSMSATGLYVSLDGGSTWTTVPGITNVQSMATDPSGAKLYVGTDFNNYNFYLCTGSPTLSCSPTGAFAGGGFMVYALVPDPLIAGQLYAATNSEFFVLSSDGYSWLRKSTGITNGEAQALAVDPANTANMYVGTIYHDGFVTAVNSSGGLKYSTYFGGDRWNLLLAGTADTSGNVYFTGATNAAGANFPTTGSGAGPLGDGSDAFISSLTPTGSLRYSFLIGGSTWDEGDAIAITPGSSNPSVAITGRTCSTDFPTYYAVQTTKDANSCDAFVTKATPTANSLNLVFSTYLGGNADDHGNGIAMDSSGNVWVVGYTSSNNFPTANAYQSSLAGGREAFVSLIGSGGSLFTSGIWGLAFSTYLGGGNDFASAVAVDASGNAFVAGQTWSSAFPTVNPYQPAIAGQSDMFIAKFRAIHFDEIAITSFSNGNATSVGSGTAVNYSVTVQNNNLDPLGGNNVVLKITPTGVNVQDSTSDPRCQFTANQTITCALGTMGPFASTTVQFSETPQQIGTLQTRVDVTSDDIDTAPNNNSATLTTAVNDYGVRVAMSHTPDPVVAGQNVTETITVTNLYSSISGGTLVFNLPAGSGNWSGPTSCYGIQNGASCTLPSLASQGQAIFQIVYAAPTSVGTYTPTVSVTTSPASNYTPAGPLSDTLNVIAGADIALSDPGTSSAVPMSQGGNVALRMTATNLGPDPASNVTIASHSSLANTLPITATMSNGASCTVNNGTITCVISSLGVGAGNAVTITANGQADTAGYVTLASTVTSSSQLDPVFSNNTAFARAEVKPTSTAQELMVVADRTNAQFEFFNTNNNSPAGPYGRALYSGGSTSFLLPNGRQILTNRSVTDLPLGLEIARTKVKGSTAVALNDAGTAAVYTEGTDTIEIVNLATFDTVDAISLNGMLGDSSASTSDTYLYGIAIRNNIAYVNPAGTNATGGGFPVATVDLSTCWTPTGCTPVINTLANTNVGRGRTSVHSVVRAGQYILALRVAPNTLLVIDTANNNAVTQVPLGNLNPGDMVVTRDAQDPKGIYAFLVSGSHILVVDLRTGSATFGQVVQNLVMRYQYGTGLYTNFSASRLAVSSDGTKLAVISTSTMPNLGNNAAVLDVASLLSGTVNWVVAPYAVYGGVPPTPTIATVHAALKALMVGYVDFTAPTANAPVLTNITADRLTNDGPTTVVITGSNFSPDARARLGWLDPIVPTSVTSNQIQLTLPAGTPAQNAYWVVTNTNAGSPYWQQVVSAVCWENCPGSSSFVMDSPPSYQPAFPLVFYNYGSNTVSIAGRAPLPVPLGSDSKNFAYPTSSSVVLPAALSLDGNRLYMYTDGYGLQALNVGARNCPWPCMPEPSISPAATSNSYQSLGGLAAGIDPISGQPRMYVSATNITSDTTDNSVFQLLAIDTNNANAGTTLNQQVAAFSTGSPLGNTDAYPESLAVTSDGKYAYALSDTYDVTSNTETDYLIVWNLASGASAQIPLASLGADVLGQIYVTPDNHYLLLSSYGRSGVPNGSVLIFDIQTGNAMNPAFVGSVTGTAPAGLNAPSMDSFVVSPSGATLYGADSNQNLVLAFTFSPGASTQVGSFVVPGLTPLATTQALALSADGQQLYVAAYGANMVQVLDTAQLAANAAHPVITSLSGGIGPYGMWVSPQGTDWADISVTMAGPAAAAPGQQIQYTSTITNHSSTQMASVSLVDHLPAGVTFISWNGCAYKADGTLEGCGSFTYDPATNTAGSSGLYLNPGDYVTGTLVVIAPSTTGTLTNTIQVSTTLNDPNLANNTASVSTTLTNGLVITTNTLPPANLNSSYSATLAAANGTPPYAWSIANGALPPGFNLNPGTGAITGTATTSGTYAFTARVTDSATQTATAQLSIAASVLVGFNVVMSHTPEPALMGGNVTETITVTNAYSSVNGGTVTFNLPSGSSGPLSGSSSACVSGGTGTVSCSLPSPFAPQQQASYQIVYSAPAYRGTYTDPPSASISTTPAQNYPPTGNLTDTLTTSGGADLAVSVTMNPPPNTPNGALTVVNGGSVNQVTFTTTVTNQGPDAPSAAIVDTVLPAGLSYVGSTATQGTCAPVSGTVGYTDIRCSLGTLGAGGAAQVSITAQIIQQAGYASAGIQASSELPDPNQSNNKGSARVQVLPTVNAVEHWFLADRITSALYPFDLNSTTWSGQSLPGYSRASYLYEGQALYISPNARLAFYGTSVVDMTLLARGDVPTSAAEVARTGLTIGYDVAPYADGSQLVYSDGCDSVQILNPATFDVTRTISFNGLPGIGDDPNNSCDIYTGGVVVVGNTAYINTDGQTAGGSGFPVLTVDLTTGNRSFVPGSAVNYGMGYPRETAVTPDGRYVLALRSDGNNSSLLVIDTSTTTPSVAQNIALPAGSYPMSIVVSPDLGDPNGTYAYLLDWGQMFAVHVSQFGTLGKTTTTPLSYSGMSFTPDSMAMSADGSTIYLTVTNQPPTSTLPNVAAVNTASLKTGTVNWVIAPMRFNGYSGQPSVAQTIATGYMDTTTPAGAPVITGVEQPFFFANDTNGTLTIDGSNFNCPDVRVRVGRLASAPPATCTASKLTVNLPAGTPSQDGHITVTNTYASRPVLQQAQSAYLHDGGYIDVPASFQPANQMVSFDLLSNKVTIFGRHNINDCDAFAADERFGALSPDGQQLYLYSGPRVLVLNLGTCMETVITSDPVSSFNGIAAGVNPNTGKPVIYASEFTNASTTANTQNGMHVIGIDADPTSATFNQKVMNIFVTTSGRVSSQIMGLAVTPDGRYAYAPTQYSSAGYLMIFDLLGQTVANQVPLANFSITTLNRPYITPDGNWLLAETATGSIAVFDIGTSRTAPALSSTITAIPPSGYPAPFLDTYVLSGGHLFAADGGVNSVYTQPGSAVIYAFAFNPASVSNQLNSYPAPGTPYVPAGRGITLSHDGAQLYVPKLGANVNAIDVLNTAKLLTVGADPFITSISTGVMPGMVWATATPIASLDLAPTMTGPAAAAPGEQITYTATLRNPSSTVMASGVYLLDTLPVGATYVSNSGCVYDASGALFGCGSGTYFPSSNTIAVTDGVQIPPGASLVLNIVVNAPSTPGPMTNTLLVGSDQNDPDQTNNTVSVVTTVTTGLVITTNTLPPATVNTAYAATLTAANGIPPYGWSIASGLPPGLSLNPSTGAITGTPTTNGTYTFTAQVTDAAAQMASAPLFILVDTPVTLSFAMSHTPEPAINGATVTETITLTNLYAPISSATFEVPSSLPGTVVSVSSNCTNTQSVMCTAGALGTNQSETFSFIVTIAPTAPYGAYSASLDSISVTPQTTGALVQPPQGALRDTLNLVPSADLSVSLSPSTKQTIVVGGNTSAYTIQVTNNGPGTPNSVVLMARPGSANPLSFASAQGTCSIVNGNSVSCNVGTLAPGASASMTVTLQGTQPGYFTLVGQASSELPDSNGSNNSAFARVEVKPTATSVERWLVADRSNAIFHTFPLGSSSEVPGSGNGQYLPFYGGANSIFLSPNARTLVSGRSVVDTTLGVEVARTHVMNNAPPAVVPNADGTRLVVAEAGDTIEIVDTATFDTINTISLNGLLGDDPSLPADSNIQGIAVMGNTAYINAAGTQMSGGGYPIFTLDLSNCWNKGTLCAPAPVAVANTAVGTGAKGPQTIAAKSSGTLFVVALRSSPNTLLIINTSTTPQTVASVTLPYAPSGLALTKDGRDPNGVFAYMVSGAEVMVMDTKGTALMSTVAMTYSGGSFNANRVAISGDGNQLYVMNTALGANNGNNVGVLDTAALRRGSISWVAPPFHVTSTTQNGGEGGALNAVLTGYIDTATPANAPVVTGYTPQAATNDGPINVTINGTGFSPDARVRWGWLDPIVPTSVSSTLIQFQLPAGIPAQTGDLIVTNSNAGSPVVQQVVSTWARNLQNQENPRVQPPASYQPAHPLVFYNFGNNSISVAGRIPFGLPWDDAAGFCSGSPGCEHRLAYPTGSANFGSYAGLSLDGARLYIRDNFGNLQALNLDTGNTESSVSAYNGSGKTIIMGAMAPGVNPGNSAPLMYVSATDTASGSTQFQLAGIDTNPANTSTLNQLVFPSSSGTMSSASQTGTSNPDGLAVTPNGHYAYAAYDLHNGTTETDYLVIYDLLNQTVANQLTLTGLCAGDVHAPVYVTPDGNYLLLLSNGTGTSCPAAGAIRVFSLATPVNPVAVASIVATPPAGLSAPYLDSYVVGGGYLFASDYRQNLVVAFNFNPGASDFLQLATYVVPPLAAGPAGLGSNRGLALADDGKLYVDNYQGNSILVLDAAQFAAGAPNPGLTSFSAGIGPLGMWVSPRATPSTDVAVSLNGPTSAAPGQEVTYIARLSTGALSNGNPSGDEIGAYLIDQLPATATITYINNCFYKPDGTLDGCGGGTPASTNWLITNNTILIGGIYLKPGGWMEMTTTVTMPSTVGPVVHAVQVGSDQNDFNQANNTASLTTNITTGLVITTNTLPPGTVGAAYSQTVSATQGSPPYTWAIVPAAGGLPPGLSLGSDGTIRGTPTTAGTYPFVVQVTDTALQTQSAQLFITVTPAQADLAIAMQPPAFNGVNVTYSVDVSNFGPGDATSVVLTDTLSRYDFVSAVFSTTVGGAGSCTYDNSTEIVTCNLGAIPVTDKATVTVVVTPPSSGWASNTFHAFSDQIDPNPANNSAQIGRTANPANTAAGANIAVVATDAASGAAADIRFGTVSQAGTTTLAAVGSGPAPPASWRAGTPAVFYDLHTTANWSGSAMVNFSFAGVAFHHAEKARLFHQENGVWVDRTAGLDAAHGRISGVVASFSLFAIFEPVNHVPVAAAKSALAPGTSASGASVTLDGTPSSDADGDTLTYRWTVPFSEGSGVVTGVKPTVTLPLGISTLTLVVNDGETDSAPVTVNATVSDFALAASGGGEIPRGQTVSFAVAVNPRFGGFSAPVALLCPNVPAGMTCVFSPATVTPGSEGATATLTVSTGTTVAAVPGLRHGAPFAAWTVLLLPAGVLCIGAHRRRRFLVLLGTLVLLAVLHVACGGGSGMNSAQPATPITITVSGTSAGLQHSTTASFTVR